MEVESTAQQLEREKQEQQKQPVVGRIKNPEPPTHTEMHTSAAVESVDPGLAS